MKRIDKVIISCAITGSIHTPTMSEALPVSAAQIAEQAIDAARAGAAILHLHARKEEDGSPTQDPELRCGGEHHDRRWSRHEPGRQAGGRKGAEA